VIDLRAVVVWIVFALTAVALGAIREAVARPAPATCAPIGGRRWPLVLVTVQAGPRIAVALARRSRPGPRPDVVDAA
jgi:hypothetical protein